MNYLLILALIGGTSALVCSPELCDSLSVTSPTNCPGSTIKNGGICHCIDACAKQAGESCQAGPGLMGRPSYGTCEKDLECVPHGEMVMLGYGRCQTPRAARFLSMSHDTPCEQQRRARLLSMAVWKGEWIPRCDPQGNFYPHQCDNIGQCFCVETHSGTMLTSKSLGDVDCSDHQNNPTTTMESPKAHSHGARFLDMKHNTKCEQERMARLMSMVVWQGQWVPVCDSQGNYVPHQCDNMGQCFCVEAHSGTMLTSKSLGEVDCTQSTPVKTTGSPRARSRVARFLNLNMNHNTKCEQERMTRLISMAVWQGQWVPVCDSQGNFAPHQCDNMGQCFCVDTHLGTMLTSKTLGEVSCNVG